jgi:hypothetical protein
VKVYRVEVAALSPESFSLGDLIDVCETMDISPDDLGPLLRDENAGVRKLKALAAVAWVIARRTEPGLTYAQVLDGRVEVIGEGASATEDPTVTASDAPPGASA